MAGRVPLIFLLPAALIFVLMIGSLIYGCILCLRKAKEKLKFRVSIELGKKPRNDRPLPALPGKQHYRGECSRNVVQGIRVEKETDRERLERKLKQVERKGRSNPRRKNDKEKAINKPQNPSNRRQKLRRVRQVDKESTRGLGIELLDHRPNEEPRQHPFIVCKSGSSCQTISHPELPQHSDIQLDSSSHTVKGNLKLRLSRTESNLMETGINHEYFETGFSTSRALTDRFESHPMAVQRSDIGRNLCRPHYDRDIVASSTKTVTDERDVTPARIRKEPSAYILLKFKDHGCRESVRKARIQHEE